MATIYKTNRSKYYYLNIYYEGRRYRYSIKTDDIKIAKRILKIREGELALKRFNIPTEFEERMLLDEFIEKYLEYSRQNKAKGTYENNRTHLNKFLEFTGNKILRNITTLDVEKFKMDCINRFSKSTCNTYLQNVKTALNKAVQWGFIENNPAKNVKMCRIEKRLPLFFELDEIKRFLGVIDDNEGFKNYIQSMLYTGCRRNEALMIKWNEIDARRNQIRILAEKTGKERTIPINDKLLNILNSMDRNKEYLFKYSSNYVNRLFKKYLKKSGIKKNLTIHSLRHTFASHLVMNGVDIFTVQKLLGHSNINMTQIYSHLSNGFIKESVKKLPY